MIYIWRKVLNEIIDFAPNSWGESHKCMKDNDNHKLAQELGITGRQLMLSIIFLEEQGLIKTQITCQEPYSANWILTTKGFDVAMANKKEKLSATLSLSIIYLTSMLWLTAFFTLVNELEIVGKYSLFGGYVVVGILFVLFCYFKIFKKLK